MNAPAISIVMPVFNAGDTIAEAIESCLQQSHPSFELIVVLDGCTDTSGEIARSFKDSRIQIIVCEHSGVTEASMQAIRAARAPLIARMDADDISHPDRLASQEDFLRSHPGFSAVSGQVRLLNPLGDGMQRYVDWVNSLKNADDIARGRFVECPVIQPSIMVRRSALDAVSGYQRCDWAEDHDLFLRMLRRKMLIGKVDDLVLSWRDGSGRLTRRHPSYAQEQVWKMKAHHLALEERVVERGVAICGAGPIGKKLARLLQVKGVQVNGFFEVNPRRVGERISDVEVVGPSEFGSRWRDSTLIGAVGIPGGRETVRKLAVDQGYREGEDFWCCC